MVTLPDIRAAQAAIADHARRTPLFYSESFTHLTGRPVYLKAENLQRTGSFKLRGALNNLSQLPPEAAKRGVVTASAGNHGQAVALAAAMRQVPSTVVVPETASLAKCEAIEGYGANLLRHGLIYDEALAYAQRLAGEHGMTFVHGFDDDAVIAGQGTVGLEIVEELPDLAACLVPVGGGGLMAGISVAVKALRPSSWVYGVQSVAAPAAARSFHEGGLLTVRPAPTIADGIAIAHPGERPMECIRRYADDVVIVDEEWITRSLVLLLERSKLVVEPAGAAALAALLAGRVPLPDGPVVVVLSGGNIDVALLTEVVSHGLALAGRTLVLDVTVPDRPGNLAGLLDRLAALGVNVLEVEHERMSPSLLVGQVTIHLSLETRGPQHGAEVRERLQADGYKLS